MKKILILLLTICTLVSYGQVLQDPSTTPSTARTNEAISTAYPTSGTDTYSVSPVGDFSYTYLTGKAVSVTFGNVNTTSSTLNFDGLGAKNIKKWSSGSLANVAAGDLIGTIRLRYDGTQFVMEGGTGSGGGASAFTDLTDVPTSYTGQSLKATRVNAGETGLEFYTPGAGSGTVTSVSVTTANGVSGSVATSTTTPAISLTLGAITPTSVNSVVLSGSSTPTLAVTGTSTISGTHAGTSSGTNTGDQTTVSGNSGTATILQTSRTIGTITGDATSAGSSFDGSANNTNALTVTKINGTPLSGLATGLLKNTTGTGVPSIASGSDILTGLGTQTANTVLSGPTSGSAATPAFRALTVPDLTDLNGSRILTTTGDTDQSDNLHTIYLSSSPGFTLTLDPLTAGTEIALINTGVGTITFANGSGVTSSGATSITQGNTAVVKYQTSTTPLIIGAAASVTPAALTKTDDTNVTLILGGTPTTALLQATSITAGWTGTLSSARGGTQTGTYTTGDILYASGTNTLAKLPIGSSTNVLTVTGGVPVWAAPTGGWAVTGATSITGAATITDNIENGLNFSHTFTATANNAYGTRRNGTLTFRGTTSESLFFDSYTPSFILAANDQKAIALRIAPTFTNGVYTTPGNYGIAMETGSAVFGNPSNAVATTVRMAVMGTGTGSDVALSIRSNANTNLWNFRSDGVLAMVNNGLYQPVNIYGNATTGIQFEGGTIISTTSATYARIGQTDWTSTAGTHTLFELLSNFRPTSGTAIHRAMWIKPTINQTGGANGNIRLLDLEPAITSLGGTLYGISVVPTQSLNGFATSTPTSTLTTEGSFEGGYVAKTATYTATVNDFTIECTANTFTVTLPTSVGISGRIYHIVNSGAGTITVGTTSSQTFVNVIATPTTLTMATIGTTSVQSNGANWLKLSGL